MLVSETVEAIFRRLSTRYGSAWAAKWAGLPVEDVKADWARVLGGQTKESVLYALDYLPDFVPTAHQFREICNRAPRTEQARLPAPKPTEESKAKVRAIVAELKKKLAIQRVA